MSILLARRSVLMFVRPFTMPIRRLLDVRPVRLGVTIVPIRVRVLLAWLVSISIIIFVLLIVL